MNLVQEKKFFSNTLKFFTIKWQLKPLSSIWQSINDTLETRETWYEYNNNDNNNKTSQR